MLIRPRHRLAALLAAGALALVAGCTGGTDAVDQTAGGDFRFVGSTERGTVIDQGNRKTAGNMHAGYLSGSTTFRLDGQRGKVVVLNYWAAWCSPCVIETPALDRLYRTVKGDGVEFVGVGVKDGRTPLRAFVEDNSISYPMLYDETGKTALQLGRIPLMTLPATVIIDRRGRVAAVYVGAVSDGDLKPVLSTLAVES